MNSIDGDILLDDKVFKIVADLIYKKAGIVLTDEKKVMVKGRLSKRLKELELSSFEEYISYLQGEGETKEMEFFTNALTTNLTSFFREAHHFADLKSYIENWLKTHKGKRFRIWSCAASSGQEPYSIAMTANEAFKGQSVDYKILATDIDSNMIKQCEDGIYKNAKGVLDEYKHHIITQNDSSVLMSKELKDSLTFKTLNLLETWPMKGPFQIIFCRNVVIYFDKPTQKILFNKIADLMDKESILYIGHSESLFNVTDRFELVGKTAYKKLY